MLCYEHVALTRRTTYYARARLVYHTCPFGSSIRFLTQQLLLVKLTAIATNIRHLSKRKKSDGKHQTAAARQSIALISFSRFRAAGSTAVEGADLHVQQECDRRVAQTSDATMDGLNSTGTGCTNEETVGDEFNRCVATVL